MSTANIADERMHPVGTAPAWSESYYFNFVDPTTKVAMFTRMGFRPGDGWADGLHVVYLGGDRVAFTYGRRTIGKDLTTYDGDLSAGDLRIECVKPFQHWRIHYDGDAQDIADAAILLTRSKARPQGWFKPARLTMTVDFHAGSEPHYAGKGERGHFEQTGTIKGSIALNGERFEVSGFGVRDKSWGPRDWGASVLPSTKPAADAKSSMPAPKAAPGAPAPFVNWFSMNFGNELALGGSCGRTAEGRLQGAGWIHRNGVTEDLLDVEIVSEYKPSSILHTHVRLTGGTASGHAIDIDGRLLTICPTKIPMPGGATFVNEGLAEFRTEGKVGYGISEHWHFVRGEG